jgi:8-amino-7-oxononanoate synthase
MSEKPLNTAGARLDELLKQRAADGLLRTLSLPGNRIDCCSNDYLGFARSPLLQQRIADKKAALKANGSWNEGSGGSRLLAGNTALAMELEQQIATFHHAESALLFNSGYDANIGFYSCVPQRGDTILYDELVHASIRDGIRLSAAKAWHFPHNDLQALEQLLQRATGTVYIAAESIYSMDGDEAPLRELAALSLKYNAALCIDEAHAGGVSGENGSGLCDAAGITPQVFARLFTYGKAFGCHGAAIVGSAVLRNYLINFSRAFIYTTALPAHSLVAIQAAYELMPQAGAERKVLQEHIAFFRTRLSALSTRLLPAAGPIQCILKPGNENVRKLAHTIQHPATGTIGFDVRAILSPTVAAGAERLRICLHAFNTRTELEQLTELLLLHA